MPCPFSFLAPVLSAVSVDRIISAVKSIDSNDQMKNGKKTVYLLTGDIGGTNSRMALYEADSPCDTDEPLVVKTYRNAEHLPSSKHGDPDAFQMHVVRPFIQHCWDLSKQGKLSSNDSNKKLAKLESAEIIACLATAGVVADNRVRMTNLGDLLVDGTAIEDDTTDPYLKRVVSCKIINDFVAQGYGCLTLKPHEVEVLHGPADCTATDDYLSKMRGPKVCIGAGTGLGECYLTPFPDDEASSYACFPSEGGHVEYAPRNDLEIKLWTYLTDKFCGKNRISVERVVSGVGLANIYEFLAHEFPERIVASVHQEFLEAGDEQGKVVGVTATRSPGSLCEQAMKIMMGAYGCEVGSAAIKWIPTGGLFVTGGLTPKNLHFIKGQNSEFMISYLNKGRVAPLLEKVPLFAVLTEDLGVRGAHKAAKTLYEHSRGSQSSSSRKGGDASSSSLSATAFFFENPALSLAVCTLGGMFLGAAMELMKVNRRRY